MANHPPVRTARALGKVNTCEPEEPGLPAERADTAGRHVIGSGARLQHFTGAGEPRGGVAGGEQAVVTNLDKTRWQHVEQEAANEGLRRQRDAAATFGGKANAVRIDRLQALIGDPHPVRAAMRKTTISKTDVRLATRPAHSAAMLETIICLRDE